MEVLKFTFLLIKYNAPTILIEWTNLLRIKCLNVKFSKYQKQLSLFSIALVIKLKESQFVVCLAFLFFFRFFLFSAHLRIT